MAKKSLVLGGNGFLGYYITKELHNSGIDTRCIVRKKLIKEAAIPDVEYIVGDAFDPILLRSALEDVNKVYCFVSTSMPNSGENDLSNEIIVTLRTLDIIMNTMNEADVKTILFPSSGGAIYGDQMQEHVKEDTVLSPSTAYGAGKQMSENLLGFYCRKHKMNALVFRIGNVYGSEQLRDKPQGVIDVFVQAALLGEPIRVWGDASKSIRDYVYLEDAARAIVNTASMNLEGINIFNIGTGIGTSVADIIELIEGKIDKPLKVEYLPKKNSGISKIVLDYTKLNGVSGWRPEIDIDKGIDLTLEAKKRILKKLQIIESR